MKTVFRQIIAMLLLTCSAVMGQTEPSSEQLAQWLKRFPDADANRDGILSLDEAIDFRNKMRGQGKSQRGTPKTFSVDPGWDADRFPDHAVCYQTPEEMKAIYGKVTSFPKPTDGGIRVVGTGHSFMAPGYGALPKICEAAGFKQPLLTHVSGGIKGSARYKWEEENGIFQFDRKPTPKLLTSIANADWDAMMWGPYYNDRPEYYSCWIDFCLKYHPEMKFYLSDSWPQLGQLPEMPKSEDELSEEIFLKLGEEKNAGYSLLVAELNKKYPNKIYILPTSDAMVLAVQRFYEGELPGVEGINRWLGKKERSLWRDQLGHLGTGFERLEGYVFYATLYGKSPEHIEDEPRFQRGDYPSPELDRVFRQIAWKAVTNHPLSGVVDKDGDGLRDVSE